ncbi:aromatic-ring-hydroxylating dioxygenase subunit beta [Niallia sp. XMNu-256]|uniref:aromatic-ring-hydroxylating dioxygenase subunit beta n=1 Tax=Niallia sp. XMNu-256 TaxID=3082444 RepID=UPI0030CD1FA3
MRNEGSLDTAYYSYYIDDEFYDQLTQDIESFYGDFKPLQDRSIEDECRRLIYKEARLLDELKLDEVLDLYSNQCLYWIPITPGGGDPRKEVSHAFDDRRRLEDRIYRLKTGYAHSQIPMSRTRRMLTNIEFSQGNHVNEVRVRANFILYELRTGTVRSYAGWYGYKVIKENQEWKKVDLKMVNLIDCDQGHENLTFML